MPGCKILLMAASIGSKDLSQHMSLLCNSVTDVRQLVLFSGSLKSSGGPQVISYDLFVSKGNLNGAALQKEEARVQVSDVLNLQFTSGQCWNPGD
jgi:hypothetical protein